MIEQALKYGVVGVFNTLLSLVVIWVLTKCAGCPEVPSNVAGYAAGLVSSFFLNRKWTFDSHGKMWSSSLKFLGAFVVCYLLQLGVLLLLNRHCPADPPLYSLFAPLFESEMLGALRIDAQFYIQMLSMAVYTVVNFVINKYYTFKN